MSYLDKYGEMVVTRTDEGLHVDRADDVILIAEEFLNSELTPAVSYDGKRFTVVATNGTFVYEVGEAPPWYPFSRVARRTTD